MPSLWQKDCHHGPAAARYFLTQKQREFARDWLRRCLSPIGDSHNYLAIGWFYQVIAYLPLQLSQSWFKSLVKLKTNSSTLIFPILGDIVPNMGNINSNIRNLSNALFTNTQQQILRLLFGQTDKSFYSKELVDKAGIGTGTVHRELEKLSGAGLLTVKRIGNQKHYQANPDSPIYEELKGIVRKTFGISELLKTALIPYQDKIKLAFIYGSVAKGSEIATSDIDLMLISDELTYPDLLVDFAELENQLGKKISPSIYTREEFRNKLDSKSSFATRVIEQPKVFLIGSENDVETI